jgi:hypothetical protein
MPGLFPTNTFNLYRYLDAQHHRTRFNNFFLVGRWHPEAALRQKARELLQALHPRPGDTIYVIIDDSKKGKRGKTMEAVAKMAEVSTATAQEQLRGLLWEDLITYLQEERHGHSLIEELERLRVA